MGAVGFVRVLEGRVHRRFRDQVLVHLLKAFETEVPGGAWQTDCLGKLVFLSEKWPLCGEGQGGAFIGHSLVRALGLTECSVEYAALRMDLMAQRPISMVLVLQDENGGAQRHMRLVGSPLWDLNGGFLGHCGVVLDETDRIVLAREIEDMRISLGEAEKTKERFLSMLTHELKTPLHGIIGFAELLCIPQDREVAFGFAQGILDAARPLLETLNGLISLSRHVHGDTPLYEQTFHPLELVEAALKRAKAHQDVRGIAVTVSSTLPSLEVFGDWEKLSQAIAHLVANALKFNHPEGRVDIVTYVEKGTGDVCVRVRDTGIGIDPEQLEGIFEPFTQGEEGYGRSFEGVGLGLSLVRHIARIHGGDVEIESWPSRGTEVTLRLPKARVRFLRKETAAA